MNDTSDFIACTAILAAVISISVNFHQGKELQRLQDLTAQQAHEIQTMERTLLLNNR